MKPSIKNKLSADRIEEANRLLNETKPIVSDVGLKMSDVGKLPKAEAAKPIVAPKKTVKMVETVVNSQNTTLSSQNTEGVSDVGKPPKSEVRHPTSVKPSRRSKIAILAEEENLRLVRVTIDIPEDLHEKMKIKMILTKQTMKDYLLDFIRKDVGNANFGYK